MTASMRQQPDAFPAARVREPTRQEFAERLLKGSVKKSYAPVVDIDWDAPLDPDKFYLPPKVVSLYGTTMWNVMSRAQQIELSRQEFVNTLSAGIWFENMLNQSLLRDILHKDPTAKATHYALTELGDETRHMVMFGTAIERVGARPVQPRRLFHAFTAAVAASPSSGRGTPSRMTAGFNSYASMSRPVAVTTRTPLCAPGPGRA